VKRCVKNVRPSELKQNIQRISLRPILSRVVHRLQEVRVVVSVDRVSRVLKGHLGDLLVYRRSSRELRDSDGEPKNNSHEHQRVCSHQLGEKGSKGSKGREGEEWEDALTSGNHFSFTFSNEAGEVTEKQTRNTSV